MAYPAPAPSPYPTKTATPTYSAPKPAPAPAPSVLGASTSPSGATLWNTAWNQGYNNSVGGNPYSGQNVGGYDIGSGYLQGQQAYLANKAKLSAGTGSYDTSGGTPTSPTPDAGSVVPPIDALLQEIDNVFNPTMDYLNNVEGKAKENYPTVQGDIGAQYDASKQSLTTDLNRGTTEINAQGTEAAKTKEDAVTAAVRLFNELKMGGQQRFGGASSAGQAFSELSNTELQRNMGGIDKNYTSTIQKINASKDSLNERFTTALTKLETDKNQALNDARREFDDKLLEITRLKTETQSAKVNMRLQALQELRNNVFQINVQNLNFKQQLSAQKQSADATLTEYSKNLLESVNGAGNAVSTFGQNTTTSPVTSLNINGASGTQPVAYTGVVNKKDQFPVGSVYTSPKDEFANNPLFA